MDVALAIRIRNTAFSPFTILDCLQQIVNRAYSLDGSDSQVPHIKSTFATWHPGAIVFAITSYYHITVGTSNEPYRALYLDLT